MREVTKDFRNQPAGFGVEHAGRLVGKNDGRITGQRSRHRHALLFPAAQIFRQMVHPFRQAHARQQIASFRASFLAADPFQVQCGLHVFPRGECGEQIESLKDVSNPIAAHARQARLRQRADLFIEDVDRSVVGRSRQPINISSVVFPLPEGPIRKMNFPASRSIDTS